MRLAARCGRLADVDAWLSEISPRQFDELVAWHSLETDYGERLDTIVLLLVRMCQAWGVELDAADFVPPERRGGASGASGDKDGFVSPNAAAAVFAAAVGPPVG